MNCKKRKIKVRAEAERFFTETNLHLLECQLADTLPAQECHRSSLYPPLQCCLGASSEPRISPGAAAEHLLPDCNSQ